MLVMQNVDIASCIRSPNGQDDMDDGQSLLLPDEQAAPPPNCSCATVEAWPIVAAALGGAAAVRMYVCWLMKLISML